MLITFWLTDSGSDFLFPQFATWCTQLVTLGLAYMDGGRQNAIHTPYSQTCLFWLRSHLVVLEKCHIPAQGLYKKRHRTALMLLHSFRVRAGSYTESSESEQRSLNTLAPFVQMCLQSYGIVAAFWQNACNAFHGRATRVE